MADDNKQKGAFYLNWHGEPQFNMAFDNWLFERIQSDTNFFRAVLRLYSWKRPAITIGYNQDAERVVDWDKVDPDLPVIRRITGGRAIYHDRSEITFTLLADLSILPEKDRSLSMTNRMISESIVEILSRVGVNAKWAQKSDRSFSVSLGKTKKSCFDSHSRYEIFSTSGKIVGGAQRRKGGCFIHQGSIKINGISGCPAIGQKSTQRGTKIQNSGTNSYEYTNEMLAGIFPTVFSSNMNIEFKDLQISEENFREISALIENISLEKSRKVAKYN